MRGRDEEDPSNTVSKILQQREKKEESYVIAKERQDEYKKALNGVASTPNGEILLKTLIKASGIHTPDKGSDVSTLIRMGERRNFYLTFIRPYLEPKLRKELEN